MNKDENKHTAQTEERKPGLKWNKEYVIFLILPVIFTILVPLGGLYYLCGRFSPYAIIVTHICMLYTAIFIFIICCFFAGIARLSREWRKHDRKRKLIIVAEIGIPLLFIVLFIVSFLGSVKGMSFFGKPFMYGLRDRIGSKADITAIRDWLNTLSKEHYTDSDGYIPYDELPKSLKVLNSHRVNVYADEKGNPKVRLYWGGGAIGHWGVEIGIKDMEIPPSDLSLYGEYRLPVEPGVYVWNALE
ncbi:MAG: hypothetical protein ACETVZ_08490 [Phycisphaerae bacterium]